MFCQMVHFDKGTQLPCVYIGKAVIQLRKLINQMTLLYEGNEHALGYIQCYYINVYLHQLILESCV